MRMVGVMGLDSGGVRGVVSASGELVVAMRFVWWWGRGCGQRVRTSESFCGSVASSASATPSHSLPIVCATPSPKCVRVRREGVRES